MEDVTEEFELLSSIPHRAAMLLQDVVHQIPGYRRLYDARARVWHHRVGRERVVYGPMEHEGFQLCGDFDGTLRQHLLQSIEHRLNVLVCRRHGHALDGYECGKDVRTGVVDLWCSRCYHFKQELEEDVVSRFTLHKLAPEAQELLTEDFSDLLDDDCDLDDCDDCSKDGALGGGGSDCDGEGL